MRKLELEREAARRALWNPVPGRVSPASSTPVTAVVQTRQLTSVATVSQGSITTASAPHGRTTAAGASSDRLVSLPQQPRHLRSSPSSSLPLPATQPTSRGLVLPTGPGATRPSIPSKPASQASAYPAAGPPATQFHPRRNLPLSLVNVWKDRPVASLSIPPPQQAMSTKGDESARQPSQPRRPDLAVTQEGLSIPGQAEKVSNITAVSSSMDTSGFEWTAEDTEWLATELQECGGKPQASEIKGWAEILECSVEDVEAKIKELA
ncbi:hypothetical protein GQ53DRAFT_751897 [Thozetella sp. PMI_491]|nr:hypothetical protein GQ53DRAFT_751897 [Thozetella sp. PMI_491]